jgi:hypothetical protein
MLLIIFYEILVFNENRKGMIKGITRKKKMETHVVEKSIVGEVCIPKIKAHFTK